MARRPLLTAAALASGAALLLTACGGTDKSQDDDKIAGAGQGQKPKSKPSATPPSSQRPAITIPKDLQAQFESWTSGDPKKDAVLQDGKERMRAILEAAAAHNPESQAFLFYSIDSARDTGQEWIGSFKKKNAAPTGSVRYSKPEVSLKGDKTAMLTYCDDESKGAWKDIKTGKVHTSPVTDESYMRYITKLERNDQGVWQTSGVVTQEGKCRP
ncbi:hypothetical protein [Streptomyces natalensis]|uniref:Lipoprotein n=1 Tax=Streptomyces natalensis ATCC 27448 TaxID=1240678 RepID=A0A0D7CJ02_9ACTN|nr:hypothetical protein [Streptomyces natalensis]KIZ15402.1 hypothetical protein SNA_28020 [Streptomyces natalensis ATCC 27448]